MFQVKVVDETKHSLCTVSSPRHENHAVYEIMGKNMIQPRRKQMKYNTVHALGIPDNGGYIYIYTHTHTHRHTHTQTDRQTDRICNT